MEPKKTLSSTESFTIGRHLAARRRGETSPVTAEAVAAIYKKLGKASASAQQGKAKTRRRALWPLIASGVESSLPPEASIIATSTTSHTRNRTITDKVILAVTQKEPVAHLLQIRWSRKNGILVRRVHPTQSNVPGRKAAEFRTVLHGWRPATREDKLPTYAHEFLLLVSRGRAAHQSELALPFPSADAAGSPATTMP